MSVDGTQELTVGAVDAHKRLTSEEFMSAVGTPGRQPSGDFVSVAETQSLHNEDEPEGGVDAPMATNQQ